MSHAARTHALQLMLEHCARLTEDVDGRPAGTLRLRQAIGEELARLLLQALVGDHRRVGLRPI